MTTPRSLRAGLHLLDRQIVDPDGRLAGKVDDLELEQLAPGEPPVVTAVLSGAGALAARIGGRFGRGIESLERRIAEERTPSRIPFGYIRSIGSAIEVRVPRDELETNRAEAWARRTIIDHIPGARHAPE